MDCIDARSPNGIKLQRREHIHLFSDTRIPNNSKATDTQAHSCISDRSQPPHIHALSAQDLATPFVHMSFTSTSIPAVQLFLLTHVLEPYLPPYFVVVRNTQHSVPFPAPQRAARLGSISNSTVYLLFIQCFL